MKLDISKIKTNKKKAIIKPLRAPLNIERELYNFNKFMTNSISKRFENQVLKQMNKSTINKFTDAQIGNYAVVYQRLLSKFKKSVSKQFSKKRIKKYIMRMFSKINKINDDVFYKAVKNEIDLDAKKIIETDGLNGFINAKSLETSSMILKLKNEMTENLSQNVLRLMSAGKSLDALYEEVTNTKRKNLNKSELIARNELKAFNQQLSDKRAENLGIKKGIWKSAGDERSRPCHKKRNNQEFDLKKGLYSSCDDKTSNPGSEINCRCYTEYIVEFD